MTDFTKEPFKGNHRGFARQRIERLLDGSGIVFNGTNPWDIQVHNSAFYRRVLINGSLGFGESYMDNMKVLDIGCGGFGKFVAQQYGVEVVEITISQAQVDLATEYCRGLPVEIRLQDYREVGGRNSMLLFRSVCSSMLGIKTIALIWMLPKSVSRITPDFYCIPSEKMIPCWGSTHAIAKYIFPNGELPSLRQIVASLEPSMVIEYVHNFGLDYDRTLMAWFNNFDGAWDELKQHYSNRFYRMWKYYLHACTGGFRARHMQLWQIIISSGANRYIYRRPE